MVYMIVMNIYIHERGKH